MKTKNNNLLLLAEYLSMLIGFLFCLVIIWNRLIRERMLRDLIIEVNSYILYLYIFSFILFIFLLFFTLKTLLKIETKNKFIFWLCERKIIIKISDFIEYYIINSPKHFYDFIYYNITIKLETYFDKICIFIEKNNISDKNYYKISLFFIIYFIRLFVSIIFIYDILFFQKFIHFFKVLPLLLLPTIFQVILYIIFTYAERNRLDILKWLNIETDKKRFKFLISLREEYINDPRFPYEVVEYYGEMHYYYIITMMTIDEYYDFEKKYKSYFYLIIYTLYCFGWGYILFNIFF